MRTLKLFLTAVPFLCALNAFSQTPATLSDFPAPTTVLQGRQFGAVKLGPGNTFSIEQIPPDFRLESFDFSPDGERVFMSWASGGLEVRDSKTGNRIAQFKPVSGPVFEAEYNDATGQLAVTGQHGLIRFVDPHSGKRLREIHTEIGKFKYDLQKVILAKDGAWIAYVNQENGKVLDLKSDPPKVLAELGDAYDLALTPDGSELWLITRDKIFGLKTDTGSTAGSARLLDTVLPTGTPSFAIVSFAGSAVAFVQSQTGLLRYELKTLTGRKVTTDPTYWVGSDTARNQVLVSERGAFSLYEADGSLRCQWKQFEHQGIKVSENGKWLGAALAGKVELWALDSLADSCSRAKP